MTRTLPSAAVLMAACTAWCAAGEEGGGTVLSGHERWVLALAFSPDGTRLVSGSDDLTLRRWQLDAPVARGEILRRFDSAVTALAYGRSGTQLAVGTWNGELLLVDPASGKTLRELPGHAETVTVVTFDPSGRYLASGGADDQLVVWDAATGEELLTFHQGNEYDVATAAFSPDGESIVTGDGENQLKVWDALSGDAIETLVGHGGPVTCASFTRGGKIVSGSWDGTVKIWRDGAVAATLLGHTADVTALVTDPTGARIVSAGEDGTVRVWNAASGAAIATWRGHAAAIRSLAISPDGRRVASGGKGEIRLWPLD